MSVYRLILMRHAKSDWEANTLTDHARPLNARGGRDAPRVGQALVERGWLPEVIVASDARRTLDTARLVMGAFPREVAIYPEPALYLGGGRRLARAVRGVPDEVLYAMLIGHNPDCEKALTYLSGEPARFATANAALLETDADTWDDTVARPGRWQLMDVLRPKHL